MQNVRAAIHLLPFGIDVIEEAPRMLLKHVADPLRLDDVDANLRTHKEKNASTAARRVAPASGLCTSRGSPGPALRSERSERRERREGCGEGATPSRGQDPPCRSEAFIRPSRLLRGCAVGPRRCPACRLCDMRAAVAARPRERVRAAL